MTFAAPLALVLLLPWSAAVAWVLLGRADFAWVPFVRFWPQSTVDAPPRRKLTRPPLPILLLLLTMLAALLAAAGPGLPSAGTRPFTLVVDRGLATTAALAGGGAEAFERVTRDLAAATTLTWIDAATSQSDERSLDGARGALARLRPTAIDVAPRLPQAVRRALREGDGPVLVLSLTDPKSNDARVRWWPPPAVVANAGIDRFAVAGGARPQAMVRVFNGTPARAARVRVADVEEAIELPEAGASRDYFFDLPALGESVTAELQVDDAVAADNVAYLARTTVWPRVEAAAALPPALGRMVRVYTDARPPVAASRSVAITADPAARGRVVILAGAGATDAGLAGNGPPDLTPHPITRDVDWAVLLAGPKPPSPSPSPPPALPPGDWRPIVRVAGVPLVAVRDAPEHAVWVGFDPSPAAGSAAYVVFWTAVLDYLGDGPAAYTSDPPRRPPPDWRHQTPALPIDAAPGVFQTPDGLRAMSTPAVRFGPPAIDPGPIALPPGIRPLRRPLLVTAVLLLVGSCVTQGKRRPPAATPRRPGADQRLANKSTRAFSGSSPSGGG
ncbi:MAG TPA: hypothetical protein VF624_08680 [Tepidisphaeraceae bacterium]